MSLGLRHTRVNDILATFGEVPRGARVLACI